MGLLARGAQNIEKSVVTVYSSGGAGSAIGSGEFVAPFARPLLELAVRLLGLRPQVVRLDAGYWGLTLIPWVHATLHARAAIPWNPKPQKRRDG
jgi:hypothetical protein